MFHLAAAAAGNKSLTLKSSAQIDFKIEQFGLFHVQKDTNYEGAAVSL